MKLLDDDLLNQLEAALAAFGGKPDAPMIQANFDESVARALRDIEVSKGLLEDSAIDLGPLLNRAKPKEQGRG